MGTTGSYAKITITPDRLKIDGEGRQSDRENERCRFLNPESVMILLAFLFKFLKLLHVIHQMDLKINSPGR